MLRFSANLSLLFTEAELIDRFSAARQHGFDAVEIQFPYTLSAESIRQALIEHRLQLVLFNVAADNLLQGGEGLACVPEKREQFRRAVAEAAAYARLLKPAAINVLPGCCFDASRKQEYLKTFKQNLAVAVEAFSPLGVKTVFEAINSRDMPGFLLDSGEQMLAVLDELNYPGLYLQYDIYHMQMMGENAAEFISKHAEKIGHIQFADCPGRGQPGTGSIDFAQVFAGIENSAYAGWIGAEYRPIGSTADSLGWLPVDKGQQA